MASDRQIETNRANGHSAAGKPRDTSLSRLNAIDHGLLAVGITEIDSADAYHGLLTQLQQEWEPQGEIEKFLIERIALSIIRVRRSVRFESEAITEALHPPCRSKSILEEQIEQQLAEMGGGSEILDPGFQVHLGDGTVGRLAEPFGRYETLHERRLFRAIEELERLQVARRTLRPSSQLSAALPNP